MTLLEVEDTRKLRRESNEVMKDWSSQEYK